MVGEQPSEKGWVISRFVHFEDAERDGKNFIQGIRLGPLVIGIYGMISNNSAKEF